MSEKFLKVGDIIQLKKGHNVYTDLPIHCIYVDHEGDFNSAKHTLVTIGSVEGGLDTNFLAGNYLVTKAQSEGGSVGPTLDQTYPDGHHVYCSKIYKKGQKGLVTVDFYQSGCFTAKIPDIKPIGRATKTTQWDIPDNITS